MKESSVLAFDDALMAVGTVNTPVFLYERLIRHPLVQYLHTTFTETERRERLSQEVKTYDGSLEKLTIVYSLLFSLFLESNPKKLAVIESLLSKKSLPWIGELFRLFRHSRVSVNAGFSSHLYTEKLESFPSKNSLQTLNTQVLEFADQTV